MKHKERCKHCAYLVEINKEWCCDIDEKPCKDIKHCDAVED